MPKYPAIINLTADWVRAVEQTAVQLPNGRYAPARPLPFFGRFGRWRAAWLVFTGRADALVWPAGQ